ncbi:MAG TPA: glycosyltransferase family 2 protein [Gemmatimonadales bacterium]
MTGPTNYPDRRRRPRKLVLRVLVVIATLIALRYFLWRVEATVNPAAVWFFWLFLAMELVGFGETALFYFTTWPHRAHRPQPVPEGRTVDLFIPTYNEPVALLRDTVVCALSVRYPHETWLLDDGNRPEVKALAAELGCRYLARTDRSHAKAGNLNNALRHSTGEFVITLDADHVPMPDLIERLLGFFNDPKVAIVQANQDFYNLDSFQHTTDWTQKVGWQQQELFFNVIQPGKDAYDAAIYCGSPAMLRRAALDEVGGFATETVTEDMHTGLRLQKRGWRVVYYNTTVARGLAPQTYSAYNTQWARWGLGAMQVLRLERPILGRGLSLGQRINYLSSFYFYWSSWQKLFYLMIPAFCVLSGIFPLVAEPNTYLAFFGPYLFMNLLVSAALQGGFMDFVKTERYNLIKLGPMLMSITGLWRKRADFKVTPKARDTAAGWRQLSLQFVLVTLLGVGLVVGILRAASATAEYDRWAYSVNSFFAAFYLYLLVPTVLLALRRKELRNTYRFPHQLEIPVQYRVLGSQDGAWAELHARNLNRFGLSLTMKAPLSRETHMELRMNVAGRELRAEASVRWTEEFQTPEGPRYANGLRFDRIAVEDQDAIAQYLFWEVAPRHGAMLKLTARAQVREVAA